MNDPTLNSTMNVVAITGFPDMVRACLTLRWLGWSNSPAPQRRNGQWGHVVLVGKVADMTPSERGISGSDG